MMPIVVAVSTESTDAKTELALDKSSSGRVTAPCVSSSTSSSNSRFSIENLLLPAPPVHPTTGRTYTQSDSPASTTRSTPEISPGSTGRAPVRQDPSAFVSPTNHCSSVVSHTGMIPRTANTPRFQIQSPAISAIGDRQPDMVWTTAAPLPNPWVPYGCFSLEQSLLLAQRGKLAFCSSLPVVCQLGRQQHLTNEFCPRGPVFAFLLSPSRQMSRGISEILD